MEWKTDSAKTCLRQALGEVGDGGIILSRVGQLPSWHASGPRARAGSANGRKERLSRPMVLGLPWTKRPCSEGLLLPLSPPASLDQELRKAYVQIF